MVITLSVTSPIAAPFGKLFKYIHTYFTFIVIVFAKTINVSTQTKIHGIA